MMIKLFIKDKHLQRSLRLVPCFLFFFLIQINVSTAQNTLIVRGRILDSISRKPIKYATVTLSTDSIGVRTSLTNGSGVFKFDKVSLGSYLVYAGNFNYVKTSKRINISGRVLVQDIGDILIAVKNIDLKEVAVVAQNLIIQSVDRLKYNVEKDPQSSGASVLNIIEKVPLLSVDPNGKIKFQGESNYRILIDNKPSILLVHNASEVLKNMPASTIKSIEVITSPSGKYLIDGITGVINIITKKRIENGYEGTANMQYKAPAGGIGAGLTQTLKQGKLGVNAYLSYSDSDKPFTSNELNRIVNDPSGSILQQSGEEGNSTMSKIISTDISYDIDSLKLLTAHFARYDQRNNLYSNFGTVVNNLNNELLQQYYTENQNRNSLKDLEFSLDFQKQFLKNKDKILTVSYLFTRSHANLDNLNSFSKQVKFVNSNYRQANSFIQNEHSVQIDLVHSVKKLKINTGFKSVARLGSSQFNMMIYDNLQDISASGLDDGNNYDNNQYLFFAYNSYQIAFKRWEILGGYRLEFANYKSVFENGLSPLRNTYFYFIPNLTFNYKINGAQALNLSFKVFKGLI